MTPELSLRLGFVLDPRGRIASTREDRPPPGPRFKLVRGKQGCAWAVHASVADEVAVEIARLAAEEAPVPDEDPERAPRHAERYQALLGGGAVASGPAFVFPDELDVPTVVEVAAVTSLAPLQRHFRGWYAEEIPTRTPIAAVIEDGAAVSACFCARRSEEAAEAGLETAVAFRGRGLAVRVTAAWAAAVRALGLMPLYSTDWTNTASRAVARKLGLVRYASEWSVGVGDAG